MNLILHHIGYAVKDIPQIADRYVGCLGYDVVTPIIHDPLQTAFGQFLRLPDDVVYLELVAPDGQNSYLAGAVRKGGGLHHLCYIANSLDTTIVCLEGCGMRVISPPKQAVAFAGRRICWLRGEDPLLIELVERITSDDLCVPGTRLSEPHNSFPETSSNLGVQSSTFS